MERSGDETSEATPEMTEAEVEELKMLERGIQTYMHSFWKPLSLAFEGRDDNEVIPIMAITGGEAFNMMFFVSFFFERVRDPELVRLLKLTLFPMNIFYSSTFGVPEEWMRENIPANLDIFEKAAESVLKKFERVLRHLKMLIPDDTE